jgi:tight adherence protein B
MALLLALCFGIGIACVVRGLARGPRSSNLARLSQQRFLEDVGVRPIVLLLMIGAGAALGGILAWSLAHMAALALACVAAGAYAPVAWVRARRRRATQERERAWPAALGQLADALEAGIAFPAAVTFVAEVGPAPLRREFSVFHARLRAAGLEAAIQGLAAASERTTDTVALLLRAGLLELPSGRLAPVLRELAAVLSDRLEAAEKARTRASSLQVEAAILAVSPVVLLLLVGAATPAYLDAYRTQAGGAIAALAGVLIFGCYLLMRRLGRVPEPRRTGGAE